MALDFIRPAIRDMEGYTPGEQPRAGERFIKINTNENPFGPSPRVMAAIRGVDPESLRRYPDPTAAVFRAAAAKLHGVSPDMILAGNGSDDILAIAMQTFLSPGDLLAWPEPTYSLYPVLAQLNAVRGVGVPWEDGWRLPSGRLLAARGRAIFLANPNAPSGTFVEPARVAELAGAFGGALLVDEAYVDFAQAHCVDLVARHQNLVICRTLSKAYSLAGLRFGYAIAQPHVIEQMNKARDSYPCDAIAIAAATAAVEDQPYARRTWEHVKSERARVSAELAKLGWTVLPSQSNFILATVPGGDGRRAYLALKDRGILVRYFDKPGLRDKLRITIGRTDENDALLKAVQALTPET